MRIAANMLMSSLIALALAGTALSALGPGPRGQISYPGNGKLYVINANGTDRRVLLSGGSAFRIDHWGGIAWSHDGKHLAFTVGNHRDTDQFGETLHLYTAAGDGTNVRPLTSIRGAFDPTWSPDASEIAFAVRGKSETSIAVIGANGRGLRTLARSTNAADFYWSPDWSPDGRSILFEISTDGRRTRLMSIHPDGTALHLVTEIDTRDHCICADWSPDGKEIAFQAPTPPRYDYPEIWVMNSDGTGQVQLTRNLVRDENPDWSPDGKSIAFYSERAGNAEIYVIPASGGQARRVTRDPWYNGAPRWLPTG